MSRAEGPVASRTTGDRTSSPPARRTPRTSPSDTDNSSTRAPNRTVAPREASSARIRRQKCRSRSVPTCGFASLTSPGIPANSAKVDTTWSTRGSPIRVVSFPSENVPAPPSPNWALLSGSRVPSRQNRATSSPRSSTGRPRSSTTGGAPNRASVRAANNPAGPAPTTTGGRSGRRTGDRGKGSGGASYRFAPGTRAHAASSIAGEPREHSTV